MSEIPQLNEFRKYVKFFCIRMVQSVIQSRLGHRVGTSCKPQGSNSDWFNVAIDELGEVTNELRQATQEKYPPDMPCLCVDIHLRTVEGDYLPLEVWAVSIDSVSVDSSINVRTQLYHSLGILLRSIISTSRSTPCYRKFSRQQSSESFILCYQIHTEPPMVSQLGEDYHSVNIGCLASPFGQINVDVYYRTRMVCESSAAVVTVSNEQRIPVPISTCITSAPIDTTERDSDSDPESYPPGRAIFCVSPEEPCASTFSTSPSSFDLPTNSLPIGDVRRASDTQFADRRPHLSGESIGGSSTSSLHDPRKGSSGNLFNLELSSEGEKQTDPLSVSTWPRNSGFPHGSQLLERRHSVRKPVVPFAALLSASSNPHISEVDEARASVTEHTLNTLDKKAPSPQSGLMTPTGEDSSDDSFVRVPMFSCDSDKIGDDFSIDMLRQMKGAPQSLKSFSTVALPPLHSQLSEFGESLASFDEFVNKLNMNCDEEND